jgi:hypothetical protein
VIVGKLEYAGLELIHLDALSPVWGMYGFKEVGPPASGFILSP